MIRDRNLTQTFSLHAFAADQIKDYIYACRPAAKIKLGLLSNPMAKTNWRSVGHDRIVNLLPHDAVAISTRSLAELEDAISTLLFRHHCNVIVVNGGDGTIHHTLNMVIEVCRKKSHEVGMVVPLPTFLFINGGGMNMLARVVGAKQRPEKSVRLFVSACRGNNYGSLKTIEIPLLKVSYDGVVRYGYIFGSEMIKNALVMYERFGQGYAGLAKLLVQAHHGYLFRTEFWYQFGHLIDPPQTALGLNETIYKPYAGLLATTVPMSIGKSLITAITSMAPKKKFNALAVIDTEIASLLKMLPKLMRAQQVAGTIRQVSDSAFLTGSFTLDGELFERGESADKRLFLTGSDIVIRAAVL